VTLAKLARRKDRARIAASGRTRVKKRTAHGRAEVEKPVASSYEKLVKRLATA
jgi:hypothetical protein